MSAKCLDQQGVSESIRSFEFSPELKIAYFWRRQYGYRD